MNTKYNFSRRIVLTISVLLTALWLPLVISAQELPKTGDQNHEFDSGAADCASCKDISDPQELRECQRSRDALAFWEISDIRVRQDRVGFGETDPTIQPSQDVETSIQVSKNQEEKIYAGFDETDPVELQRHNPTAFSHSPENGSLQSYVGFSETTPVAQINQSAGESPYQSFMDCLNDKDSGMALKAPEFSSLNTKDNHHEHC